MKNNKNNKNNKNKYFIILFKKQIQIVSKIHKQLILMLITYGFYV